MDDCKLACIYKQLFGTYLQRLNCRIPYHLFASHWIRRATIATYLVLQSLLYKFIACNLHNSLFASESCINSAELQFNALRNFVWYLANYHLRSRIFLRWTRLRGKIALCSSESAFDTPWNFTRTFVRASLEKSLEQRTKFTHFPSVTLAHDDLSY